MSDITTEAGKRLREWFMQEERAAWLLPHIDGHIAAIEAEAYEKGHACAERTSAAAAALHRKEARAAVLARVRERVEAYHASVDGWDQCGWENEHRAAVLAILEEEA